MTREWRGRAVFACNIRRLRELRFATFDPCRELFTEVSARRKQAKGKKPHGFLCRPSRAAGDARTVLAGKGSRCRAKKRRALAACAPF